MLDSNITLLKTEIKNIDVRNESLLLSGCNVKLHKNEEIYSEFDELNFSYLNSNDYGCWNMEIELCFENNFKNPYQEFYARCFTIRTDNGIRIKINGDNSDKTYSKVNKDNKFVIGIGYFFSSEEEKEKILNCKLLCLEGFVALQKKKNVYGIMCRLCKDNDLWEVMDANTYRISKGISILNLFH